MICEPVDETKSLLMVSQCNQSVRMRTRTRVVTRTAKDQNRPIRSRGYLRQSFLKFISYLS